MEPYVTLTMIKILFITLSNIGDVVLTLPALDFLKESFPAAEITVLVGLRPKSIFENSPQVSKVIIYDKHSPFKEKIKLFQELKKEKFELVVDLRNSFLGVLLPARYKTSPFLYIPAHIRHMQDRHLYRVTRSPGHKVTSRNSLYISPEDEEYIKGVFKENNISEEDKIIVVASGARSHIKRWPKEKFVELISALVKEFQVKVVLVGDGGDAGINKYIARKLPFPIVDLTAQTTIAQLACLLKKAELLVTNDSAVLHIGSYLNIPILGIFGPTDESKYAPWSGNSVVVKKDIFCRPCAKAQCRFGTLECM
ncbi:MAG: glycosyltransferase family 9 protein, partial [Candidatus Omnitrophica bacterium]|nr:glycosyltransferase family 9 protein [Candidatus Omnitrophota bacterium]